MNISNWTIPTDATANELMKLYELASTLEPGSNAVEIGSYLGASATMIAMGLSDASSIYCIDTWKNDAMSEGKWDTYDQFLCNTEIVQNKIVPIRSKSVQAANQVQEPIHLLFIDGDHSYEGIRSDVNAWFHWVQPGGVIVLHDWGWAEGVQKITNDIIIPQLNRYETLPNMFWGWKS